MSGNAEFYASVIGKLEQLERESSDSLREKISLTEMLKEALKLERLMPGSHGPSGKGVSSAKVRKKARKLERELREAEKKLHALLRENGSSPEDAFEDSPTLKISPEKMRYLEREYGKWWHEEGHASSDADAVVQDIKQKWGKRGGGSSSAESAGLMAAGFLAGLLLPDVDQMFQSLLHHRSILTHSVIIPFLFRKHMPRSFYVGMMAGIAVHLLADSLSVSTGYSLIYLPIITVSIGPFLSLAWILANVVIAVHLAKKSTNRRKTLTVVATVMGVLYALINEGSAYLAALIVLGGCLVWRAGDSDLTKGLKVKLDSAGDAARNFTRSGLEELKDRMSDRDWDFLMSEMRTVLRKLGMSGDRVKTVLSSVREKLNRRMRR